MTNDQGRLMILYIIYYIIKVNRASSMLNLVSVLAKLQIENIFRSDQQMMLITVLMMPMPTDQQMMR